MNPRGISPLPAWCLKPPGPKVRPVVPGQLPGPAQDGSAPETQPTRRSPGAPLGRDEPALARTPTLRRLRMWPCSPVARLSPWPLLRISQSPSSLQSGLWLPGLLPAAPTCPDRFPTGSSAAAEEPGWKWFLPPALRPAQSGAQDPRAGCEPALTGPHRPSGRTAGGKKLGRPSSLIPVARGPQSQAPTFGFGPAFPQPRSGLRCRS